MYANANLLLRIFFNAQSMLNVTACLRLTALIYIVQCASMWFDCTKTALIKLKVAYNNSLRR